MCLIFWGSTCQPEPAAAFPEKVVIDLFQARQPLRRIILEAPAQIRAPYRRLLLKGVYEIQVDSQLINIRRLGNHSCIQPVSAKHFHLTACSRKGIALRCPGEHCLHYYGGEIDLLIGPNRNLKVINVLPAKEYVYSVVGSETFSGWAKEALKAQAILTQTRLVRYKPDDVLGDSTQQEAYLGKSFERADVVSAVDSVWGHFLAYHSRPIQAYYHSTCAGKTSGDNLFSGHKQSPYLVAVNCNWCKRSPFCKQTRTAVSCRAFQRVFACEFLEVQSVDATNRPLVVRLDNGRIMRGYDFWIKAGRCFGWDKIPGMRFLVSKQQDGSIAFISTGAGHGVGLCQWGAEEQASNGKSYRQILEYYFPGAAIN